MQLLQLSSTFSSKELINPANMKASLWLTLGNSHSLVEFRQQQYFVGFGIVHIGPSPPGPYICKLWLQVSPFLPLLTGEYEVYSINNITHNAGSEQYMA